MALTLEPRALAAWALRHLHPVTAANTVNFPLSHGLHSNRLFWRVDEDTLIGRFYLMHMIAIRPETQHFVIGSSCDYSFIPEMCPSGNVVVVTDSDDYLVVEMQPRQHERSCVGARYRDAGRKPVGMDARATARTPATRAFHAARCRRRAGDRRRAERFIAVVEERLSTRPQRTAPSLLARRDCAHRWRFSAGAARRRNSRRVPTPRRAPMGRSAPAWRR